MKKLSIIILILIFCQITASSQSCLPDTTWFSTQIQIDNFQTNYPGCTEIEGDLLIRGNDITNLIGLSVITSIGVNLWISDNSLLTSLTGLDNVTSIGRNLWIGNNNALTSLTGLDNLSSIEHTLYIKDNDALTSLTGLDNVTSIGGNLWIGSNDALTSLAGLDNVTSIGTYLEILNNSALVSLSALINVTSIGLDLEIYNNDVLTSLTGLDNIDAASIANLQIYWNSSLSTCEVQSVCDYLASPGGTISIFENAPGCNSQVEVEEACEDFSIDEQLIEDYLSLYPTPAHQDINISVEGKEIEEISIYTLTGQQVLQKRPVNGTIDISDLQPGMYIVEVTIENKRFRQKFLVQR